jgi:hypothetical protein
MESLPYGCARNMILSDLCPQPQRVIRARAGRIWAIFADDPERNGKPFFVISY